MKVSTFVERALYQADHGFYERGGRAGRRGDFVTSPEVGPLFGKVLGRALDAWWSDLGRPDPFYVHEHGAGPGTLARTVLKGEPSSLGALRWVMVERSAAQRALHPEHLPHVARPAGDSWSTPGDGPLVSSADHEAATGAAPHVIVANELLDNLPFDLAEMTVDGWREVLVTVDGDGWTESFGALEPATVSTLVALASEAGAGARAAVQRKAGEWVAGARHSLRPGGHLVTFDYAMTTGEMAERPQSDWLRAYRDQQQVADVFAIAGSRDITVHVALDQIAEVAGPPTVDLAQADWLRRWGLDELVEEARSSGLALAGPDALAAMRLRSRLAEGPILSDPQGVGGFRVWEWTGTNPMSEGK